MTPPSADASPAVEPWETVDPIPGIPPDLLRPLYPLSPAKIAINLAAPWIVLAGAVAAAVWFHHPAVYAAAFAVIGWRQYALLKLTHEASHYLFSRNKRGNDLLANLVCSFPIGMSVQRYRAIHLSHHRHLGTARDPDLPYYRIVASPGRLIGVVLLGLSGLQGLSALFLYHVPGLARLLHRDVEIPGHGGAVVERSLVQSAGIAVVQVAIAGAFYLAGHPFLYLILWIAPLFTILPTLNRLRTIAEHTPSRRPAAGSTDIGACTRTTLGFRVIRALLAPLNFSYHFEHHLLPGVPFHQLPRLHRLLAEQGFFKSHEDVVSPGYGKGLWELCRKHEETTQAAS